MEIKTIGMEDAAKLLRCHRQTVLRYVRAGALAGSKIGREWVFLISDIEKLIRSGKNLKSLTVPETEKKWHCTNEVKSIGLASQHQTERELDALLKQPIRKKHRSFLTN